MIFNQKKFQFIFKLRSSGVTDSKILTVMENIPRDIFIRKIFISHAFDDIALPINCGQTITQPSTTGIMAQALNVTPRCKVLEIGTGSGYQTAILAKLGRRIYSIERHQELSMIATNAIEQLAIANVTIVCADGTVGLVEQAPFDRIVISAAVDDIPPLILSQLKPNGILVAPVGHSDTVQTLVKVEKTISEYNYTELKKVRFSPLEEGKETLKIANYQNL